MNTLEREDVVRDLYELIENLGGADYGSSVVLYDLVKFLRTERIAEFIEHFKQQHNITGYNEYELCMDCQATYDSNSSHRCDDGKPKYFTSQIPEC